MASRVQTDSPMDYQFIGESGRGYGRYIRLHLVRGSSPASRALSEEENSSLFVRFGVREDDWLAATVAFRSSAEDQFDEGGPLLVIQDHHYIDTSATVRQYLEFLRFWRVPAGKTLEELASLYIFSRRYQDTALGNALLWCFATPQILGDHEAVNLIYIGTQVGDPARQLVCDTWVAFTTGQPCGPYHPEFKAQVEATTLDGRLDVLPYLQREETREQRIAHSRALLEQMRRPRVPQTTARAPPKTVDEQYEEFKSNAGKEPEKIQFSLKKAKKP